MEFIIFKDIDDTVREQKFRDLNLRLTAASPLRDVDGTPFNWADPRGRPDNHWLAMPIEDWCKPLMSAEELALVISEVDFKADSGWTTNPTAPVALPWWDPRGWWK